MKTILIDGKKYKIEHSKKVSAIGDVDEIKKIIYIDKSIPEKFLEGIAVHEIEERKWTRKGHSYAFSHNQAQKKEMKFYEKILGKGKGLGFLKEEEKFVLKAFGNHLKKEKRELKVIKKMGREARDY